MMELRKQKCVRKCNRKFENEGMDIRVYYSFVRHSTSEAGLDLARTKGLKLENRRYKIRGLFTTMGMFITNVNTIFHREVRITIRYMG